MTLRNSDFDEIRVWDNENFVHPWEGMEHIGQNERTFTETADGIYVTTEAGKRLIDGPAGMWCVQIGYGNGEIADAMATQARDMAYFSPFNNANSVPARLAHEIAKRTPGDLNHVFFTTGGSTAVDTAIRFVHFRNNILGRPEKKIVISRQKAYHGSTFLAASVSGKERDKGWLDQAQGMSYFLPNVNPYIRPEGMSLQAFLDEKVADLENAILEIGADKVAAFIAEPILASGGVIVPPKGYHKRCLDICRKYDVLYISDEVVTGWGRLGHWFASEDVFDIVPDIITTAKGLTSGYVPMGACIISDALIDSVSGEKSQGATFSNGYTYSGHPVSAIAALKNIEIFEREGILEHVREVSPLFQERLTALGDFPIVGDTRGMGLVGCVECVVDSNSEDSLDLDKTVGARIDHHCQELGLILRPIINMCVFSPPLIINVSQINQMFDIMEKGIKLTTEDLAVKGLWSA
ncbi:aminotransferase [Parasedimentitalea psychrophila]|uniref:Aminotransferase n=1 Tax=Parasedimentitalea psychrophila TaxID=2997337 RepID=A0A9Y2P8Z1_9RHOB|nr:aminotransferase [Parasedimentitalea psychrophila]WIY27420.1 aminotransferase [Parasedimentitalea psychrophila]